MDIEAEDLDSFSLGERVRAERKRLGFTQRELCSITHISAPTMSLIEAGNRYPTVRFLNAFCSHGANLEYLVRGYHGKEDSNSVVNDSLLVEYQEQLDQLLNEQELIEESIGEALNSLKALQKRVRNYKRNILKLAGSFEKGG